MERKISLGLTAITVEPNIFEDAPRSSDFPNLDSTADGWISMEDLACCTSIYARIAARAAVGGGLAPIIDDQLHRCGITTEKVLAHSWSIGQPRLIEGRRRGFTGKGSKV